MVKTEQTKLTRWATALLCIVLGGGLAYLILSRFLPLLLPFLIAWLISLCVTPLAKRISKRLHLSQKLCATVLLLLFLVAAVTLVALGVGRLASEIKHLFDRMIAEYGSLEAMLSVWMGNVEAALASVGLLGERGLGDPAFREKLYGMLTELLSQIFTSLASALPSVAGHVLSALPSFLLASVVAVIAAFYFCIDREHIMHAILSALPRGIRQKIPAWQGRMRRISWRYLRAYLLLMLITFGILLFGFLVLDIPYALLLASVAAVVDMLPVLGVGTVLLPWAAVVLIQKQFFLGFGLLILYGICTLVRQVAEPKLIGRSLGLHPLLTVFATYVGFELFGLIGMLLAPVFALIGKTLYLQLLTDSAKKD